jgi:glycosyltransferase involved in cell wall biosynthesis
MNEKHILCLASWYPNENAPTLGNFVQQHVEELSKHYKVTLFYISSSIQHQTVHIEEEKKGNLNVFKLYYPKSGAGALSTIYKFFLRHKLYKQLYKSVQSPIDLVHVHVGFPSGLFALYLKRKYKIPFVITEHWTGYLAQTALFSNEKKLIKKLHQLIFKKAADVMVVSEHLGQSMKNLSLIEHYRVIPNPVDPKVFFPSKTHQKETFQFIHISTCDELQKNCSGILHAFKELTQKHSNTSLTIITENDPKSVQNLAEKVHLEREKFNVFGVQSRKKIAEFLRNSNCFILFSNYETFSIVLAEAWMSGIPCIYSQCGGLTEINDPKLGIQITPKNNIELVNAMEYMLLHKQEYHQAEIREYAQKYFTSITLIQETEKSYRKALSIQ